MTEVCTSSRIGCDSLDRITSKRCILATSLRALASLETLISLPPSPVTTAAFGILALSDFADYLVVTARWVLFDPELSVFVSGEGDRSVKQCLGDSRGRTEQGASILKKVYANENAVKAVTPYLHH
jgi:hypothetical protein